MSAYASFEIEYEDGTVTDEHGKIVISEARLREIEDWFDELGDLLRLRDRVAAILERVAKSGTCKHIAYDPHAGQYVFIWLDDHRSALTPMQLDKLFTPVEHPRPQSQVLYLVN